MEEARGQLLLEGRVLFERLADFRGDIQLTGPAIFHHIDMRLQLQQTKNIYSFSCPQ